MNRSPLEDLDGAVADGAKARVMSAVKAAAEMKGAWLELIALRGIVQNERGLDVFDGVEVPRDLAALLKEDWFNQSVGKTRTIAGMEICHVDTFTDGIGFEKHLRACKARLIAKDVDPRSAGHYSAAYAEMASNAVEHGGGKKLAVGAFALTASHWWFSVVDLGVGIPASLRTNPTYAQLSDEDATARALVDGVSRFADTGRGTGFGKLMKALVQRDGRMRIRSGGAVATGSHSARSVQATAQVRRGTAISAGAPLWVDGGRNAI